MGAGAVRSLGIVSCLILVGAAAAAPSAAAPITLPGLLSGVAPNAFTARFEKCMSTTAPATKAPATNGPVLRANAASTAAAGAVHQSVPSVADCLANLGLGDQPQLRGETALCLRQRGIARTICFNRVFAPFLPPPMPTPAPHPTPTPVPTPTPTPTATPRPTPTPTRRPTIRPTRRPTPRPTPTPTPRPTATPTPKPTATPTPKPTRKPTPRPTRTPTPTPTARAIVLATATPAPTSTPTPIPTPTPTPTPALTPTPPFGNVNTTVLAFGGLGGVLGAAGVVMLIRTRTKHKKDRPQMHRLTLAAPGDGSIAVAGTPVTFTAQTDPPNLASKITWSVTTQPGVHGIGPAFAHTFAATGVEQVVARLGDDALACDVIVYVFKTPSGGSTLNDILHAERPVVARSAASFTRYGTSASAPGKAS